MDLKTTHIFIIVFVQSTESQTHISLVALGQSAKVKQEENRKESSILYGLKERQNGN